MRAALILLVTLAAFAAPTHAQQARGAKILAIGDSLMAWHRGEGKSISDALAAELGEPVINRSISGARIIYALPISGALGMRIPNQFRERDRFDWVIVNGGGNDIWMACGCGPCKQRLNRMLTPDAKGGDIVSLIARIRKTGARVIYLGYLRSPGFDTPIENCKAAGDTLEARLARLAKRDRGVYFHSIANLVPHGDLSFHGVDRIHPSRKASAIIGKQLAQIIKRADRTR